MIKVFLLSSTGQIENCTGHLSVVYATIKLMHVFMVGGWWFTVDLISYWAMCFPPQIGELGEQIGETGRQDKKISLPLSNAHLNWTGFNLYPHQNFIIQYK